MSDQQINLSVDTDVTTNESLRDTFVGTLECLAMRLDRDADRFGSERPERQKIDQDSITAYIAGQPDLLLSINTKPLITSLADGFGSQASSDPTRFEEAKAVLLLATVQWSARTRADPTLYAASTSKDYSNSFATTETPVMANDEKNLTEVLKRALKATEKVLDDTWKSYKAIVHLEATKANSDKGEL